MYSFFVKIQCNSNNIITTVYVKIIKNMCMWMSVNKWTCELKMQKNMCTCTKVCECNIQWVMSHNTAWPKPLHWASSSDANADFNSMIVWLSSFSVSFSLLSHQVYV